MQNIIPLASLQSLTFLSVDIEIIHTCKVTICSDSLGMDSPVQWLPEEYISQTLGSDKIIFDTSAIWPDQSYVACLHK